MFEKLVTISRNKELGKILIDADFNKDHILKVKTFSKCVYCVVKYMKQPTSYVLTVWNLESGNFSTQYEFQECSNNESISIWAITKELIACAIDNQVLVYDISHDNSNQWKLQYKYSHDNSVNCISLNDEMGYSSNIIASADSNVLKISSIHSKECLYVIKHQSICDIALMAVGSICTIVDLQTNDISLYCTSTGNLIRKMEIDKSEIYGKKQISFEKNKLSFFFVGDCEYKIYQFGSVKRYGYKIKKNKRISECNVL